MTLDIKKNVSLAPYTTLHIGGVADYVVEVRTKEEVKEACLCAQQTNKPLFILGGGSNVLIADDGYRGLVVLMNLKGSSYADGADGTVLARFGAGEVFDDMVAQTCIDGLWGLENLSSIPGSVGATPVQNVGAYGVDVSQIIVSVETINKNTGEEKIFSNDECNFMYRDSFFKTKAGKDFVITAVTFLLSKFPQPKLSYADVASLEVETDLTPLRVREVISHIRANKFPDWSVVGTAGSFFKNPTITANAFAALTQDYPGIPGYIQADGSVKVSLGFILDKVCNLRGYARGNVSLYNKQALVLVATKNATAKEIKQFAQTISEKVFEKTKIKIECEVLFV